MSHILRDYYLYEKDDEYVVSDDGKVMIVDEFTGRLLSGRRYSDGLHQAIEAKEGVKVERDMQTLATITLQNYFRLYKKLAGMTGTAETEAGEFWKIYKLEVVNIPTNKPLYRVNYPDMVFMSEKEKWEAVVGEIEQIHKFDVAHMKDGTEVIGQIKNETDTELVVELKESRERQTIN